MDPITTEGLARFIVNATYEDLSRKAIEAAKRGVLDWLGVAMAGAEEVPARIVSEHVRVMGSSGQASVLSCGFGTSADLAAWVNGISGHALDYDDTFPTGIGWNFHPTAPVLPAALALGEQIGASGKDLLLSYALGVQVELLVGNRIGRDNTDLGWHTLSTIGTLGSIAACAKILRLDVLQTRWAFGTGSAFAGGLRSNLGTMAKSLQAGNAARAGVVAASLAGKGFTGKETILEERLGFMDIFSGARRDPAKTTGDPSTGWALVQPGLAFKPYPCCRATHTSIDAALTLKAKWSAIMSEVSRITCTTSAFNRQFARSDIPLTGIEGKFSIPYCVALSLLYGRPALHDFTDDSVNDPAVHTLFSSIEMRDSEQARERGLDLSSEIEITMKSGIKYVCRAVDPKGEPENPLTDEELALKFHDCVSGRLSVGEIEKLQEMIADLESIPRISSLLAIARGRPPL